MRFRAEEGRAGTDRGSAAKFPRSCADAVRFQMQRVPSHERDRNGEGMRRPLAALAATGIVLALAGCAGTPVAFGSGTSASSTPAPSSSTAAATTSSAPPPAPIPPPVVYQGNGDTTLAITKPAGTTSVVVTVTGNAPGHYLGVRALDGKQDHLVDANGPYSGSTLLDADGGTTTKLFVRAVVPWTITLSDPRTAPVFTQAYQGTGDTVLTYEGSGGTATINGGVSGSPFVLKMFSGGQGRAIATGTGPYSGTVRWPSGTSLIAVKATGQWTVSVG